MKGFSGDNKERAILKEPPDMSASTPIFTASSEIAGGCADALPTPAATARVGKY